MSLRELTSDFIYLPDGLVSGKSILMEEKSGEIIGIQDAGEQAEYFPGILCPGFINSHCHLELSHLKGKIPPRTGMAGFIQQLQSIRNETEIDPTDAANKAAELAFSKGVQAIGDISNSLVTSTLKRTTNSNLPLFYTFLEVFGLNSMQAPAVFEAGLEKMRQFPNEAVSLTWHAPYSMSPALMALLSEVSQKEAKVYSIHLLESQEELDLMEKRCGPMAELFRQWGFDPLPEWMGKQSVTDFVLAQLPKGLKMLWVHAVHVQGKDIAKLTDHSPESAFCLCPLANQYIHGTLPPADLLWHSGAKVVLGTDSLAGNAVMDIGEELKLLSESFPQIPTSALLSWATGNGAEFFGWHALGRFTKGAKPGVLQIFPLQQGRIFNGSLIQRIR